MEGFVVDKVDTQFGLRSDGAVDENGVYYSTKTASVINLDLSCLSCGPMWTFGLRTANANRPSVPLSSLIPLSQRNDPKHRFNSNNHKCSRITYVGGAYALDSCTGRKLWYTGVPYSESSDPVIGDTTIYLGTSSSFLYALDSVTGKILFNTSFTNEELGTGATTTPAYSEKYQMVFVGTAATLVRKGPKDSPDSHDGFVFGVNATTGQIVWKWTCAHEFSFLTGPTLSDPFESLYISSTANSNNRFLLHSVHLSDGKERWSFETHSRIAAKPVLLDSKDRLYLASTDGTVSALRLSDGSIVWESRNKQFDSSIIASPSVGWISSSQRLKSTNGRLYVGTNAGSLYAVSLETGTTIWKVTLGPQRAGLTSSPMISLRPMTQQQQQQQQIRNGSSNTPALNFTGYLVVIGSLDGYVYSVSERHVPTALPTFNPTITQSLSQVNQGNPLASWPHSATPTSAPNFQGILDAVVENGQNDKILLLLLLVALVVVAFFACRRWRMAMAKGRKGNSSNGPLQLVSLGSSSLNPLHRAMSRPPPSVASPWASHVFSNGDGDGEGEGEVEAAGALLSGEGDGDGDGDGDREIN